MLGERKRLQGLLHLNTAGILLRQQRRCRRHTASEYFVFGSHHLPMPTSRSKSDTSSKKNSCRQCPIVSPWLARESKAQSTASIRIRNMNTQKMTEIEDKKGEHEVR